MGSTAPPKAKDPGSRATGGRSRPFARSSLGRAVLGSSRAKKAREAALEAAEGRLSQLQQSSGDLEADGIGGNEKGRDYKKGKGRKGRHSKRSSARQAAEETAGDAGPPDHRSDEAKGSGPSLHEHTTGKQGAVGPGDGGAVLATPPTTAAAASSSNSSSSSGGQAAATSVSSAPKPRPKPKKPSSRKSRLLKQLESYTKPAANSAYPEVDLTAMMDGAAVDVDLARDSADRRARRRRERQEEGEAASARERAREREEQEQLRLALQASLAEAAAGAKPTAEEEEADGERGHAQGDDSTERKEADAGESGNAESL